MKTQTQTSVATAKTNVQVKDNGRKSLHPLQQAATDKENLVGAGRTLRSSTGGTKTPLKTDVSNKIKTDVSKNTNKSKLVSIKNDINKKNTEKTKPDLNKSKETKKVVKDSKTKAGFVGKVFVDDLTSEAEPSIHYWKLLAEKRATENEQLKAALEVKEASDEKLKQFKDSLLEKDALIEKLKNALQEKDSLIEQLTDTLNSITEDYKESLAENEILTEQINVYKEEREEYRAFVDVVNDMIIEDRAE